MFREPQLIARCFDPRGSEKAKEQEEQEALDNQSVLEEQAKTEKLIASAQVTYMRSRFFKSTPPSDAGQEEHQGMSKILDKKSEGVSSMAATLKAQEREKRAEWALPPKVEGVTSVADGIPPLHGAAKHGDLKVVKRLIGSGHDADKPNPKQGLTPLWFACRYGQVEVIEYLLSEESVDWQATDRNGANLIWAAAFGGHKEAIHAIIRGVGKLVGLKRAHEWGQTADYDQQTPVFAAAMNGHLEAVEYLCTESTADVNAVRWDGASPLFIAANNNHLPVVKFLVDHCKANTDLARHDGQQPAPGVLDYSIPLKAAHHNGHFDVVNFLMGK